MNPWQSYHEQVRQLKRGLVQGAVISSNGNRTLAAKKLGIQRTYLVRLIRQLDVSVPPPPPRPVKQ